MVFGKDSPPARAESASSAAGGKKADQDDEEHAALRNPLEETVSQRLQRQLTLILRPAPSSSSSSSSKENDASAHPPITVDDATKMPPPPRLTLREETDAAGADIGCNPDIENGYSRIGVLTAKCSICDQRNASPNMLRCVKCAWSICEACQCAREEAGKMVIAHGKVVGVFGSGSSYHGPSARSKKGAAKKSVTAAPSATGAQVKAEKHKTVLQGRRMWSAVVVLKGVRFPEGSTSTAFGVARGGEVSKQQVATTTMTGGKALVVDLDTDFELSDPPHPPEPPAKRAKASNTKSTSKSLPNMMAQRDSEQVSKKVPKSASKPAPKPDKKSEIESADPPAPKPSSRRSNVSANGLKDSENVSWATEPRAQGVHEFFGDELFSMMDGYTPGGHLLGRQMHPRGLTPIPADVERGFQEPLIGYGEADVARTQSLYREALAHVDEVVDPNLRLYDYVNIEAQKRFPDMRFDDGMRGALHGAARLALRALHRPGHDILGLRIRDIHTMDKEEIDLVFSSDDAAIALGI